MMMKLMKFLIVALVAGGVCASVPSQAEENKLLLIKCNPDYHNPVLGKRPHTMWFTIDLERETVKSWTHDLKIGVKEANDRVRGYSYIDISDRLFKIHLKQLSGGNDYVSIVRLTGEWNDEKKSQEDEAVIGLCERVQGPGGQRMELHPPLTTDVWFKF